jgi:hypothetical protein
MLPWHLIKVSRNSLSLSFKEQYLQGKKVPVSSVLQFSQVSLVIFISDPHTAHLDGGE